MSAYCIFLLHELYDRPALESYWAAAPGTMAGRTVTVLSTYREFDLLEDSEPLEAVVLIEFETLGETCSWYRSDSYQVVKQLRQQAGRYTGSLVDGGITPAAERVLTEVLRP